MRFTTFTLHASFVLAACISADLTLAQGKSDPAGAPKQGAKQNAKQGDAKQGDAKQGATQDGLPKGQGGGQGHGHEGHNHEGHNHEGHDHPPITLNKDRPIPEGCWFKPIHLDFGSHVENAKENLVEGVYEFENPTKESHQIKNLTASCKCQYLKFFLEGKEVVLERKSTPEAQLKNEIEVKPGAKGKIVMKFDVSGGSGSRTGEIRVETTDPRMQLFSLTAEAIIKPAYQLEPDVVLLGKMGPAESKEWSCKVRCLVRDVWSVERAAPPLPHGLTVASIEKGKDDKGTYYEIKGTYGPDLEEGAAGGNLLFETDDKDRNFMLEVRAEVREQVQMTPRFFSFSSFPRNKAQEKTIYLWPTDTAQGAIHVDRIEILSCNIKREFVEFEVVAPTPTPKGKVAEVIKVRKFDEKGVPADKLWKVLVRVKKDVPGRILRVKANIHLKGKGLVPKGIQFNGFPKRPR